MTANITENVPRCSGTADPDYLAAALERAGMAPPAGDVSMDTLVGGRTGATVIRVKSGHDSYVLKTLPESGWRGAGMDSADGGEPRLWLSGLTQKPGGSIRCPVIDVAYDDDSKRFWMLMRDVGAGIRDRGEFTRDDSRWLFGALSEMHALHYQSAVLDQRPLPSVGGTVRVFSEPLLHLAGHTPSEKPWVAEFLSAFQVLGVFLPLFLDLLKASVADQLLQLVADEGWKKRLERHSPTLLHGDLRRANIAFASDGIELFDWEFAAKGAPGCDLQWHCFLHYWAYPPTGVAKGDDCDDLRDEYFDAFENALGRKTDRAELMEGWKLGWIKVVCQLGYVLADPLYPDGGDAATRAVLEPLCERAVTRALDYAQSLA